MLNTIAIAIINLIALQGAINTFDRQLPNVKQVSIFNVCGKNNEISAKIDYIVTKENLSISSIVGNGGRYRLISEDIFSASEKFSDINNAGLSCSQGIGEITIVGVSKDGSNIALSFQINFDENLKLIYQ